MKRALLALASVVLATAAQADLVPFALSPWGASPAVDLSPANEVPPVVNSMGSGGEILTGITFDTFTRTLNFAIGYGTIAVFTDLTGPGTGFFIQGPANASSNGPVVFNLAPSHLPAGDPTKGGMLMGTAGMTDLQAADLLAGLYYVNICTDLNPNGEIRGQLIPLQNVAPTIECPPPIIAECTSRTGTPVRVTVKVGDADGDALTVVWRVDGVIYKTNQVPGTKPTTSATVPLNCLFQHGTHDVMVTVTDTKGISATCETTVTVQDTKPPVIRRITRTPSTLWPPNHQMVPVSVAVVATDVCGPVTNRILSVWSSEPENATGDGNTEPDWEITGALSLNLRAERAGNSTGRTYFITVESTDGAGNSATGRTTVTVPHSQGAKK